VLADARRRVDGDNAQRLHNALHRGGAKATEEELADITAVVLAVVAEIATELAEVIGELAARVEALEAR
jgi:hypothetical protein